MIWRPNSLRPPALRTQLQASGPRQNRASGSPASTAHARSPSSGRLPDLRSATGKRLLMFVRLVELTLSSRAERGDLVLPSLAPSTPCRRLPRRCAPRNDKPGLSLMRETGYITLPVLLLPCSNRWPDCPGERQSGRSCLMSYCRDQEGQPSLSGLLVRFTWSVPSEFIT